MRQEIDEKSLVDIELLAVKIARQGGLILSRYFGQSLKVEYKDAQRHDPVTNADRETQDYLQQAIEARFPAHGILGEEDSKEKQEAAVPVPDFVWVLDPLDGTRNFLHGLPIYACSIGVLYRGEPVVGAVFVPWPVASGGIVCHARRGGGAFADGEPISVIDSNEPKGDVLVTLPGYFEKRENFKRALQKNVGELRVTGSIAYELVMVARGITQYLITTRPHLWDVAGGVAVVMEAGGGLWSGSEEKSRLSGVLSTNWENTKSLVPNWESGKTTVRDLHHWIKPLVLANPGIGQFVTSNLQSHLIRKRRFKLPWQ